MPLFQCHPRKHTRRGGGEIVGISSSENIYKLLPKRLLDLKILEMWVLDLVNQILRTKK